MNKNDFGYEQVEKGEHYNKVQDVFNNVANEYDLMNDFMSFGLHRNWKKEFVDLIEINDENKTKILDLAGGTGDIAKRILKNHPHTSIEVIDKNFMMLKESNAKNNILKYSKVNLICGDGENIPLNDNSIDIVTLSFGIRNMTDRLKLSLIHI